MRLVIDTNVLVSAILRDGCPERVLRWIADSPDRHWLTTDAILAEYDRVLPRGSLKLNSGLVDQWLCFARTYGEPVTPRTVPELPRDPSDGIFLACAIAGAADYIISGDRDLTSFRRFGVTTITSPGQFERVIMSRYSE